MNTVHLKFESRFFLAILLSLVTFGVAASVGSGWALFLSCSALGAAILSLVMPYVLLSQLKVRVSGPAMVDAGDSIPVLMQLETDGLMTSMLRHLIVRSKTDDAVAYPGVNAVSESAYLQDLADRRVILSLNARGMKRGIRALPAVLVETSFPMGLVWVKASYRAEESRIVVLPKTVPLEGAFLKGLRSDSYVPGDSQNSNHGFQTCYARGIREYNRTDSRRHIHWAVSARHGRLMVKEFENEGVPVYDVAFDLAASWGTEEQFELAVSAAASLLAFGHAQGIHPELLILNEPVLKGASVPSSRIVEIQEQLLALASLEQSKKKTSVFSFSDPSAFDDRARALILITPDLGEAPVSFSIAEQNKVLTRLHIAKSQPSAGLDDKKIISRMEDLLCL